MKKSVKILFVCAALCLLGYSAFRLVMHNTVRQIHIDRVPIAASVSQLQEVSDLIVVVEPESRETKLQYYDDGNVSVGYTETVCRVERVLHGKVPEGDTVRVTEECYRSKDGVLWTQQGYLPMKDGERYLLFLSAYGEDSAYAGMFFPIDLEYGKYVLPNGQFAAENIKTSAKVLQVGEATDLSKYEQWYQEIRDIYSELFQSKSKISRFS
ncbi:MAG: hypothetical protein J1F23_05760 [Oscillospiraceae bacterium]|nr:hypothetical protein [Oscillospiraceae bacterium]